jgi:hypothetical protein
MKNGFKVLQFRSRYNYLATFGGWVRHVRGDHYEMVNFTAIVRKSGYAWDGLMRLAAEGPSKDYTLTNVSAPGVVREFLDSEACNVHACIESAWETKCPRPKDWSEE